MSDLQEGFKEGLDEFINANPDDVELASDDLEDDEGAINWDDDGDSDDEDNINWEDDTEDVSEGDLEDNEGVINWDDTSNDEDNGSNEESALDDELDTPTEDEDTGVVDLDSVKDSILDLSSLDGIVEDEQDNNDIFNLSSSAYTREYNEGILIDDLIIGTQFRSSRGNTLQGLTTSIATMGICTPIAVLDLGNEMGYLVLDGLRRVYGATASELSTIPAIIWKFKDKEKGKKLALTLGLVINKTTDRTWSEKWNLIQILEGQGTTKPRIIEYLLSLNSGDYVKFKDIMSSTYSEVKDALLNGDKDLLQAFKMLDKLRKDEDIIGLEDEMSIGSLAEDGRDIEGAGKRVLSDDDTKDLLELADDLDSGVLLSDDDFSEYNKLSEEDVTQQTVGDRHPLDPALRQSVLIRDDFKCQCCGTGGAAYLSVLAVHHIIPVHAGGKDIPENLITLCLNHHVMLHVCEKNMGVLPITKQDYTKYTELDKTSIQKAVKLARIAVEASKRAGRSKEDIREDGKKGARHIMPGEGLKENTQAFNSSSSKD